MRCWFVPKRSAETIREAVKRGGKVLEALRPDAKLIDAYQHPLGDVWVPILKPLQEYIKDQHGLEAEASKINSRLRSPIESVVKQGEKDAEASWTRRANEFVEAGGDPKYVSDRLPKTPAEAAKQAYWYAKQAAVKRFQHDGWDTGLLGPANSPNHVPIILDDLEQGPGRYLGVLKGLQSRVTQTLSAFEPRKAPADAMGKVKEAYLGVKHTAVGLNMWSPTFHPMTILGRFLPTLLNARSIGRGLKSLIHPADLPAELMRGIKDLERARTDPAEAERLARLGLIQLGPHGYEGRLMTQMEAALKKGGRTGSLARGAIAGYKNAMQWGINNMGVIAFRIAKDDLMSKGVPEQAAEVAAAQRATIIVGTIPKDMMTRGWRGFADFYLFSMRYTTSTWLTLARAMSKDRALESELKMMGFKGPEVEKTLKLHQKAFQALLVKDLALFYGLSNVFNYVMTGIYNLPDKDGKKGPHFVWENPGSTWYTDLANVKFVAGKDPATGKTQYAQIPIRGTRDLAMMVLQLPAWLTGADPFDAGALQVYANKASPLVAVASMLYSGRDWRGKSLSMPTTAETTANWVGSMADLLQPLPTRDALVRGATYLSQGDYSDAVIRPWVDMLAEAQPGKLAARAMGIQESSADPVASQYYRRQESWRNWYSDPAIRADLKAADPVIVNAYFNAAKNAGVPYSEAAAVLMRIQTGRQPKGLQQAEAAVGQ